MADNKNYKGSGKPSENRQEFIDLASDKAWFINEGGKVLNQIGADPKKYGFTKDEVRRLSAGRNALATQLQRERPDEFFIGKWYPGGVGEVAAKRAAQKKEFEAGQKSWADVNERGLLGNIGTALKSAELGLRLPIIAEEYEKAGLPGELALEKINWNDPYASGGARFGFGVQQSFPSSAGSIFGNVGGAAVGGFGANLLGMALGRSPLALGARGVMSGLGAFYGGMKGAEFTGQKVGDAFNPYGKLSQPAKLAFLENLTGPEQELGEIASTAALFSPWQRSPLSGKLTLGENVGFREGARQFIENPARLGTSPIVGPAVDLGSRLGQMSVTQNRIDKGNQEARDVFQEIYGREGSPEEWKQFGYKDEKGRLNAATQDLILGGFTKFGTKFAFGLGGDGAGIEMPAPTQGIGRTQAQQTVRDALSFTPPVRGTETGKFVLRTTRPENGTLIPIDIMFDSSLKSAQVVQTSANMSDSFWAKLNRELQRIRPVPTTDGIQSIVGIAKFGEFFVTVQKGGTTELKTLTFNELSPQLQQQARKAQQDASVGEQLQYDVSTFNARQYSPVNDSYENFSLQYPATIKIDGKKVYVAVREADDPVDATVRLPSGVDLRVPKALITMPRGETSVKPTESFGPRTLDRVESFTNLPSGVQVPGDPVVYATLPQTVAADTANRDAWKRDYFEYDADGETYQYENLDELNNWNPVGTVVDLGKIKRGGRTASHRGVILGAEQVNIDGNVGFAYRVQSLTLPSLDQFYAPPALVQPVAEEAAAPPATPSAPVVTPAAAAPSPATPPVTPPATAAATPPADMAATTPAPAVEPTVTPESATAGTVGSTVVEPVTPEETAEMQALLAELEAQIAALESMVPTGGEAEPSAMSTFDLEKAAALAKLKDMARQLREQLNNPADANAFRETLSNAKLVASSTRSLALTGSSSSSFALPPGTAETTVVAPTPSAGTPAVAVPSEGESASPPASSAATEAPVAPPSAPSAPAPSAPAPRPAPAPKAEASTGRPRPGRTATEQPKQPEDYTFSEGKEFKEVATEEELPAEMRGAVRGEEYRYRRQTAGVGTLTPESRNKAWLPKFIENIRGVSGRFGWNISSKGGAETTTMNVELRQILNKQDFKQALKDVYGQTDEQAEALSSFIDRMSIGWAKEILKISGWNSQTVYRAVRNRALDPDVTNWVQRGEEWRIQYREQAVTSTDKDNLEAIKKLQTYYYAQRLGQIAELSDEALRILKAPGVTQGFYSDAKQVVNVAFALRGRENYNAQVHEVMHLWVRSLYAPMIHELASKISPKYYNENALPKNLDGVNVGDFGIRRELEEQIVTAMTIAFSKSDDTNKVIEEYYEEGGAAFDPALQRMFADIGVGMRDAAQGRTNQDPQNILANRGWILRFDRAGRYPEGTPLIIKGRQASVYDQDYAGAAATVIRVKFAGEDSAVSLDISQIDDDQIAVGQLEASIGRVSDDQNMSRSVQALIARWMGHYVEHTNNLLENIGNVDVTFEQFDPVGRININRLQLGYRWWKNEHDYKIAVPDNSHFSEERIARRTDISYLGWLDTKDNYYEAWRPSEQVAEMEFEYAIKVGMDYERGGTPSPAPTIMSLSAVVVTPASGIPVDTPEPSPTAGGLGDIDFGSMLGGFGPSDPAAMSTLITESEGGDESVGKPEAEDTEEEAETKIVSNIAIARAILTEELKRMASMTPEELKTKKRFELGKFRQLPKRSQPMIYRERLIDQIMGLPWVRNTIGLAFNRAVFFNEDALIKGVTWPNVKYVIDMSQVYAATLEGRLSIAAQGFQLGYYEIRDRFIAGFKHKANRLPRIFGGLVEWEEASDREGAFNLALRNDLLSFLNNIQPEYIVQDVDGKQQLVPTGNFTVATSMVNEDKQTIFARVQMTPEEVAKIITTEVERIVGQAALDIVQTGEGFKVDPKKRSQIFNLVTRSLAKDNISDDSETGVIRVAAHLAYSGWARLRGVLRWITVDDLKTTSHIFPDSMSEADRKTVIDNLKAIEESQVNNRAYFNDALMQKIPSLIMHVTDLSGHEGIERRTKTPAVIWSNGKLKIADIAHSKMQNQMRNADDVFNMDRSSKAQKAASASELFTEGQEDLDVITEKTVADVDVAKDVADADERLRRIENQELRSSLAQLGSNSFIRSVVDRSKTQMLVRIQRQLIASKNPQARFFMQYKSIEDIRNTIDLLNAKIQDPAVKDDANKVSMYKDQLAGLNNLVAAIDKNFANIVNDVNELAAILESFALKFDGGPEIVARQYRGTPKQYQIIERMRFERLMAMMLDPDIRNANVGIFENLESWQTSTDDKGLLNYILNRQTSLTQQMSKKRQELKNVLPATYAGQVDDFFGRGVSKLDSKAVAKFKAAVNKLETAKKLVSEHKELAEEFNENDIQVKALSGQTRWDHSATDANSPFWILARAFGSRIGSDFVDAETKDVEIPSFTNDPVAQARFMDALSVVSEAFANARSFTDAIDKASVDTYRVAQVVNTLTVDQVSAFRVMQAQRLYESLELSEEKIQDLLKKQETYQKAKDAVIKAINAEENSALRLLTRELFSGSRHDKTLAFLIRIVGQEVNKSSVQTAFGTRWRNKTFAERMVDFWQVYQQAGVPKDTAKLNAEKESVLDQLKGVEPLEKEKRKLIDEQKSEGITDERKSEITERIEAIDKSLQDQVSGQKLRSRIREIDRLLEFAKLSNALQRADSVKYYTGQVLEAGLRVQEHLENLRLIPAPSEFFKIDNKQVKIDIATSDTANVSWQDALAAIQGRLKMQDGTVQTIEQRYPNAPKRYQDILKSINIAIEEKRNADPNYAGEKRQVLTNEELIEIVRLNRDMSASGLEAAGIFAELQSQRDEAVKKPLADWLKNEVRKADALSMRELNDIFSDPKLGFTEADKLAAMSSMLRITSQLSNQELHNFILVNRRLPTALDVRFMVASIKDNQARDAKIKSLTEDIEKLDKLQAEVGLDSLVNRAIATRVSYQVGKNMDIQNFVSFVLPVAPMNLKVNDAMAAQSILEQMSLFDDNLNIQDLMDSRRIEDSYASTEGGPKPEGIDTDKYRKAISAATLRDALVNLRGFGLKSPLRAKGVQLPGAPKAGEKAIQKVEPEEQLKADHERLAARIIKNGSEGINNVVTLLEEGGIATFSDLNPDLKQGKLTGLRSMWANTLSMETLPPAQKQRVSVALAKFADGLTKMVFDARMNIIKALETDKYSDLTFVRESPDSQVVLGKDVLGRVLYKIDYRHARAYEIQYVDGIPKEIPLYGTTNMVVFNAPEGVVNSRTENGKFVWNQAQFQLYKLLTNGVPNEKTYVHQAVADAVETSAKMRIAPDVYWFALPRVESGMISMTSSDADPMFMSTLIEKPEHVFRSVGATDPVTRDKFVKPVIGAWLKAGENGQPRIQLGVDGTPVFDGYGYTVWDENGKRSHIYAKLRGIGLSHDKALEVYALTEHPAFKNWMAGDLIEAPMMGNPGSFLNQGRNISQAAVPIVDQGIKAQDLMYAIDRFQADPSDDNFDNIVFAYDELKLLGGQLSDKELIQFVSKIKTSKDRDLSLTLLRSQAEQMRDSVSNQMSDVYLKTHAAYKESEQPIRTGKKFTTMAFDHVSRSILSYAGKGIRTFDLATGLYNNNNRSARPSWVRFKNPLVVSAENNNPSVTQIASWVERATSGKYDGIVIKDVVDSYNDPTRRTLAVVMDETNVLPVSSMTTPFEDGIVATANDFEPMFMSTMIAPVTTNVAPPIVVGQAISRQPTAKEIAFESMNVLSDNLQALSRMPLSLDLAFTNIQGGKPMLAGLLPLRVPDQPVLSTKGWKFDTTDFRLSWRAFFTSLQGLLPNMQVTIAGQKIGLGKFGRRQWLRVYMNLRQDPYFQLMKELGVPLHFLNFERKLDSERTRIYQENKGNIAWDQISINMLDYDERGNMTDIFEKNTLVGMLPLQGMFERQMSLQHDLLLYYLIRNQMETNPQFRDLLKGDPSNERNRRALMANASARAAVGFTATALGDFQYTTSERGDIFVSRLGKWVSGAPRWYFSNVALSQVGNWALSQAHTRSAWFRQTVGSNNRSYHLYEHENPELRAWQQRMHVGNLMFWGMVPVIVHMIGNLLLDREDIKWGGFFGRMGSFRIGDVQIAESTGTWDLWNFSTGFLKEAEGSGGAGARPRLGETEQEAKMEPYWGAYKRLQYRWSPAITLLWNKLLQGKDVLGRAVFKQDPEFTKVVDDYYLPEFANPMARMMGLPEIKDVPFSSRLITGQFPTAWSEAWSAYAKASEKYPSDPDMAKLIYWGQKSMSGFGYRIKYQPFVPQEQMDFFRDSMYLQRKYDAMGPTFKDLFNMEFSKALRIFFKG